MSREIETPGKSQKEMLEIKNTDTEVKNAFFGGSQYTYRATGRISKPEDIQ